MTKLKAVQRMLEKAEDRYGDNHPITEALRRQADRIVAEREAQPTETAELTD
ncbi:MAG: hypothetical protein ACPGUF_00585 [Litorivicinus sp.]